MPCLAFHLMPCLLQRQCAMSCVSFDAVLVTETVCHCAMSCVSFDAVLVTETVCHVLRFI